MNKQEIQYLLEEKREFKSFKELCEHLGVEYNGITNSRRALEKKFRQFFEFEKVKGKNKIIVTEVFDKIKPNFKSKGSSLPEFLDPAILSELKEGEVISNSQIAERIGITSKDIIKFYGNIKYWGAINIWLNDICTIGDDLDEEKLERKFKAISYFVSNTHSSYNKMIEKSLERLKKKNLIDYEQGLMIYFPEDYIQNIKKTIEEYPTKLKEVVFPWLYKDISKGVDISQYTDCEEYLEVVLGKNEIYKDTPRPVTKEEEHFINSIKKEVLKKYECKSETELMSSSRWDRNKRVSYYTAVNKKFSKYNIKVFKGYYIKAINEDVEYDKENRSEINAIFYNKMIHNNINICERRYRENLEKEKYPRLKDVELRRRKYFDIRFHKEFAGKFIKVS